LTVRQVLYIPSIVWAIIAVHYGVGLRDAELPSSLYAVRAGEYVIYWELLYFVSSTLIKSAIGFTCIRIDQRRRVTHPVLLNISIMGLIAVLAIIFVFANCRPLAATWNPAL
jgi:NO-binding membrane sensor protein with MHYT domain